MKNGSDFTILLVEDDDLDVERMQRAMRKLDISNRVVRAVDGCEALDKLRGCNGHEPITGPVIVLLDLNMPRMNGFEFLAEIRRQESLRRTPVYVMSTSDRTEDIDAAYQHNISGYVVKPFTMAETCDTLRTMNEFWTTTRYPSGTPRPSR